MGGRGHSAVWLMNIHAQRPITNGAVSKTHSQKSVVKLTYPAHRVEARGADEGGGVAGLGPVISL